MAAIGCQTYDTMEVLTLSHAGASPRHVLLPARHRTCEGWPSWRPRTTKDSIRSPAYVPVLEHPAPGRH